MHAGKKHYNYCEEGSAATMHMHNFHESNFRVGAYKRDAVVVIQLGAYIHKVLTTFYG